MSLESEIYKRLVAAPGHPLFLEHADAVRAISAVLDKHRAYRIFDECGHRHEQEGDGVRNIESIGFTCDDGYQYSICFHCCTEDSGYQTEACAEHPHSGAEACWPCPTVTAIADALGVGVVAASGMEDR